MAERQEVVFLSGEGDAWFDRNSDAGNTVDPVTDAIVSCGIIPTEVLEVGCGTGWRLNVLKNMYPCLVYGIDPSAKAVAFARQEYDLNIKHGTSGEICGYRRDQFDMVIFGFCLYLVDRDFLFRIIHDTDDVLRDGGHIVIHDFLPDAPHKKAYHHKNGVFSYKMDYAKLWLGNPAYQRVYNSIIPEDGYGVSIIKKDNAAAWPERA